LPIHPAARKSNLKNTNTFDFNQQKFHLLSYYVIR